MKCCGQKYKADNRTVDFVWGMRSELALLGNKEVREQPGSYLGKDDPGCEPGTKMSLSIYLSQMPHEKGCMAMQILQIRKFKLGGGAACV